MHCRAVATTELGPNNVNWIVTESALTLMLMNDMLYEWINFLLAYLLN